MHHTAACLGPREQLDPNARPKSVAVPKYQVNLDLPPRARWAHIINKYLPEFERMKAFIVKTEIDEFGTLGPFFTALIKMGFAASWRMILPPELSEELEGIVEITSKFGLDYRTLLILNIGYDLVARCTSIVAPAADGTPCLLRNMDWESPVLHSTTIDVDFMRDGKVLYQGTTWAGFVGLLTGVRPVDSQGNGGYAITLNYRQVDPGLLAYFRPLWGTAMRRWPAGALIREVLSSQATYDGARREFCTQHTLAPCYLTLAGTKPGEGCILARSACGVDKLRELPKGGGALVQTNIDHDIDVVDENWAAGDPLLLNSVDRRKKAQETLTLPCDPSAENAWQVLETPPVLNELTIYSVILCPAKSVYRSRLQFPEGTPATHHTGRIHRIIDFLELAST